MPYLDTGEYLSLFPHSTNLLKIECSIALLCCELPIFALVAGLLIYLHCFNTKIRTSTLCKLQVTTALSVCTMAALLSQFIETLTLAINNSSRKMAPKNF